MKLEHLALALALLLLQACSGPAPTAPAKSDSNAAASPPAAAAAAAAAAPAPVAPAAPVSTNPHEACNLVTAAEMSAIVGSPMTATPHDDPSLDTVSNCAYAPASGRGSSVDFTVMWGDGESTLRMAREMKHHDAEADKRFAGVGDDAVVVPPAVQVRQGKDALVFTLFGFDDEPATLKKILKVAKPRM